MGSRKRCRTWDLSDTTADSIVAHEASVGVQCDLWNGSDTTDAASVASSVAFSVASSVAPEPSEVDEPRSLNDNAWDETVPWPCYTYMIVDKATGRPLTINPDTGEVFLAPAQEETKPGAGQEAAPTPDNTWYCANSQNYFGFLNAAAGRYLGHNGFETMHARSPNLRAWETFTARSHPQGGYQLLTPSWAAALQVVDVAGDGRHLIRRTHGGLLWGFRRIQK